jgi:hypothetical protein
LRVGATLPDVDLGSGAVVFFGSKWHHALLALLAVSCCVELAGGEWFAAACIAGVVIASLVAIREGKRRDRLP